MHSIKGKAILSINDHPDIRECFKALKFEEVNTTYTVGGSGKADDSGTAKEKFDLLPGYGVF